MENNEENSTEIDEEMNQFKAPNVQSSDVDDDNKMMPPTTIIDSLHNNDNDDDDDSNRAMRTAAEPPPIVVIPLKYKQPQWSCVPPTNVSSSQSYNIEVLKLGTIVQTIHLSADNERLNPTFVVIGRQPTCDIVLEHPSISRHHAILQFGRDPIGGGGIGWHLYDMGSAHGSFRNKQRIPTRQYVRVHVGHVLQFGGSTRMFVMQGPETDMEPESALSVTELKHQAEQRKHKSIVDDDTIDTEQSSKTKREDTMVTAVVVDEDNSSGGISWGMSYDDEDRSGGGGARGSGGEELDVEMLQKREQFYKDDPKKALTKFFEREGYELKFEYEEEGSGFTRNWLCRIELPIDSPTGQTVYASTTATSKRDAQHQCSLEACRILDAHGILRRSGDVHLRRKLRTLKENDYYDSDEDTFLDRTGQLEQQQAKRRRRHEETTASVSSQKVDTYESLTKKLESVNKEMTDVREKLESIRCSLANESKIDLSATNDDALDAYMRSVGDDRVADKQQAKIQTSQLSSKLVELKHEADRLGKLVKIAKPVALPELQPRNKVHTLNTAVDEKAKKFVWIGSIKGRRIRKAIDEQPKQDMDSEQLDVSMQKGVTDDQTVEQDDDDDTGGDTLLLPSTAAEPAVASSSNSSSKQSIIEKKTIINDDATTAIESQPSKTRFRIRKRQQQQQQSTINDDSGGGYAADGDDDYAMWMPPANQSGDGRTSLNDKFAGRY